MIGKRSGGAVSGAVRPAPVIGEEFRES